jgi:hypothetical protein
VKVMGDRQMPTPSRYWLALGDDAEGRLDVVRELSEDEYREFQQSFSYLYGYLNRQAYLLAAEMGEALESEVTERESVLQAGGSPYVVESTDAVYAIMGRFVLFLEATRLFLNQVETMLKRDFGPTSTEWVRWKTAKSAMFDDHFAYRFCYDLRNTMHEDMPSTRVSMSERVVGGNRTVEMRFELDPVVLIERYEWHPRVRADLETVGGPISVMPVAKDCWRCIQGLMRDLMLIQLGKASDAARVIRELMTAVPDSSNGANNGVPVIVAIPLDLNTPGEHQISTQTIPAHWPQLIEKAAQGSVCILRGSDVIELAVTS